MNILEGKTASNAYTLMTYSTLKERDITNKNLKRYVNLLKQEKTIKQHHHQNVKMNSYFG